MKRQQIIEILFRTMKDNIVSQDITITEESNLLGDSSPLDSMGLVNFLVDVESVFQEEGYETQLTSEKAMSKRQSPFRSISTLADFIEEQIIEIDENGK